jgi:hypothetical protein
MPRHREPESELQIDYWENLRIDRELPHARRLRSQWADVLSLAHIAIREGLVDVGYNYDIYNAWGRRHNSFLWDPERSRNRQAIVHVFAHALSYATVAINNLRVSNRMERNFLIWEDFYRRSLMGEITDQEFYTTILFL